MCTGASPERSRVVIVRLKYSMSVNAAAPSSPIPFPVWQSQPLLGAIYESDCIDKDAVCM